MYPHVDFFPFTCNVLFIYICCIENHIRQAPAAKSLQYDFQQREWTVELPRVQGEIYLQLVHIGT